MRSFYFFSHQRVHPSRTVNSNSLAFLITGKFITAVSNALLHHMGRVLYLYLTYDLLLHIWQLY